VQQKKKPKNFARNKRAFDKTFALYRALSITTALSAQDMSATRGATRNPAKPTPLDFRCDIDNVVKLIVPKKWLIKFYATYTTSVSESEIEQGIFEDKMLGGLRHSFEQRIGDMLCRKKIYQEHGNGYFHSVRKARCDQKTS
jgi:hypothetical protein